MDIQNEYAANQIENAKINDWNWDSIWNDAELDRWLKMTDVERVAEAAEQANLDQEPLDVTNDVQGVNL